MENNRRSTQSKLFNDLLQQKPRFRLKIEPESANRDFVIQDALIKLQNDVTDAIDNLDHHIPLSKRYFRTHSIKEYQSRLIGIILAYLITLEPDEITQFKIHEQDVYKFLKTYIIIIGTNSRQGRLQIPQTVEHALYSFIGEAFLTCVNQYYSKKNTIDLTNKNLKYYIGKLFWTNIEFSDDPFVYGSQAVNSYCYTKAVENIISNIDKRPRSVVYVDNPSPAETAINRTYKDLQEVDDFYK